MDTLHPPMHPRLTLAVVRTAQWLRSELKSRDDYDALLRTIRDTAYASAHGLSPAALEASRAAARTSRAAAAADAPHAGTGAAAASTTPPSPPSGGGPGGAPCASAPGTSFRPAARSSTSTIGDISDVRELLAKLEAADSARPALPTSGLDALLARHSRGMYGG
eukprot:358346-Chlamydomonas_euryale.AAC.6